MDGDCGEEGNDENNKLHKFLWKGSRFRPIWPMIAVNIPSLQSGDFDLFIDRSDQSGLSDPTDQKLSNNLLQKSCAVAMTFRLYTDAMQQGQPCITKRSIVWYHNVFTKFDVGSTSGEEGGAVAQLVTGTDVTSVDQGDVVEQTTAVFLLGGFEFVEETCQ